jgi:hypothetical protein
VHFYLTTFPLLYCYSLSKLRHFSCHGTSFPLPSDTSQCPVLTAIMSQLFPPHDHLEICDFQEFVQRCKAVLVGQYKRTNCTVFKLIFYFMISSTCFEPEDSSLGSQLHVQVWYSVFYMNQHQQSCTYKTECKTHYTKRVYTTVFLKMYPRFRNM